MISTIELAFGIAGIYTLLGLGVSGVAKVHDKLMEDVIKKMVDDAEEESYASEFIDYVFLNEEDDYGTRLEPGSHKENPETVDDDDDDEEAKKNEMKDGDNDDHTDHTLVETQVHENLDKVLHEIIPQIASRAIDDLIKDNLKRTVAHTVIQERDAFQAEMKSILQDTASDLELWDVLKRKFKKSSTSNTSYMDDAFHTQDHDDH
uniref:Uncharacterized protein n=1 Tax=Tanacetum cinerariifolium TaxID=118510 RepID=A0A699J9T1_TANCI|nr:hypothetical protein [Tanacetum cinerariifolium]